MKWFLSLVLAVSIFSGCSVKSSNNLTIKPYTPKVYSIYKNNSIKKIYLKSVRDLRSNPKMVGMYEQNGKYYGVLSDVNVAVWLYEGLINAFKKRGYEVVQSSSPKALTVMVDVLDLHVNHYASYSKNNTFSEAVLKLKLKKDSFLHVKKFKTSNTDYFITIPSKNEYENKMRDMLEIVLDRAVKNIFQTYEMRNL